MGDEVVKGILLAGGNGTRLNPTTIGTNKHLLPVYDKPMIYYPLATLMLAGVTEVSISSSGSGLNQLRKLLGDGSKWGIKIDYLEQKNANGIADAIRLHIKASNEPSPCLVLLGDNFFYGQSFGRYLSELRLNKNAVCWTQTVRDPANYGIAVKDSEGKIQEIQEKPKKNVGNLAVTGMYYFPSDIRDKIESLKKSERGEFEITEVLNQYIMSESLEVVELPRGVYWSDMGTVSNLLDVSLFVRSIQDRQALPIGSPEEASWRMSRINSDQFKRIVSELAESGYRTLLDELIAKELGNSARPIERGLNE